MILNPITLKASKMLSTMTTLIGQFRVSNTLEVSNIVSELVSSCNIGNVDFGKGIVYTFPVDVQEVKNLTETSSALTITKPNVGQETIEIDSYKFIPLSVSNELLKDAILSGEGVSTFLGMVMDLMDTTQQFHMFDLCNSLYQDWTPVQATQTIEVDQIDLDGLEGAELNESMMWNANNIAKTMRKTMRNMMIKNKKFTDTTKYNVDKDVMSALKKDNLKLVMNDEYYTDITADSLAKVFNEEKISGMIPGEKFVVIPTDAMAAKNADVIGWLSHKEKFAVADFYKLTGNFADPSTLYTNYFLHFSYGAGVFKFAPGVVFKAKLITKGN